MSGNNWHTPCDFSQKLWSTSYQISRHKITDSFVCYRYCHVVLCLAFSQLSLLSKSPYIFDAYILFITFPNNVFSLHEKETQFLYFYDFIQSISNTSISYKIFCRISCLWFWHQPKNCVKFLQCNNNNICGRPLGKIITQRYISRRDNLFTDFTNNFKATFNFW